MEMEIFACGLGLSQQSQDQDIAVSDLENNASAALVGRDWQLQAELKWGHGPWSRGGRESAEDTE